MPAHSSTTARPDPATPPAGEADAADALGEPCMTLQRATWRLCRRRYVAAGNGDALALIEMWRKTP